MNLIITVLKGFSEVFFLENIYLGIIILIGIFIASPTAAILAIIGNVISTLTGYMIHPDKSLVDIGVYGLNGTLLGVAVAFYIKNLPIALVLVIIGSVITGILYYLIFKTNIHPIAIPFTIVTLGIILLKKYFLW